MKQSSEKDFNTQGHRHHLVFLFPHATYSISGVSAPYSSMDINPIPSLMDSCPITTTYEWISSQNICLNGMDMGMEGGEEMPPHLIPSHHHHRPVDAPSSSSSSSSSSSPTEGHSHTTPSRSSSNPSLWQSFVSSQYCELMSEYEYDGMVDFKEFHPMAYTQCRYLHPLSTLKGQYEPRTSYKSYSTSGSHKDAGKKFNSLKWNGGLDDLLRI